MKRIFPLLLFFVYGCVLSQNSDCHAIILKGNTIWHSKANRPLKMDDSPQETEFLLLDFDGQSFCGTNEDRMNSLIVDNGYVEIKSRFKRDDFSIFIMMRRKPYEFRFDIQYLDAFQMPYNKRLPFLQENHQTVEGQSTDLIYNNKWISVNGINYSSALTVSDTAHQPIVGMGFIKGFNWIIDRQHKKVYIKKNTIGIDTQNEFVKTYAAGIKDNQIVILSRNAKSREFQIGDIITVINKKKVTLENIAELAELLSKTQDWQLLDIEIAPK